jgi:hypothetical protein
MVDGIVLELLDAAPVGLLDSRTGRVVFDEVDESADFDDAAEAYAEWCEDGYGVLVFAWMALEHGDTMERATADACRNVWIKIDEERRQRGLDVAGPGLIERHIPQIREALRPVPNMLEGIQSERLANTGRRVAAWLAD